MTEILLFDLVIVAQNPASESAPALDTRIAADLPTVVHDALGLGLFALATRPRR